MSRTLAVLAAAIGVPSAVGLLTADHAAAELLSGRPITVVIPFTPGASSDTFQRLVAKQVSESTGQVIIVESRPGGGGTVGAMAGQQAPPQRHTLLQGNSRTAW